MYTGRTHSAAWLAEPLPPGQSGRMDIGLPEKIPPEYGAIHDCSLTAVRGRLKVLYTFSDLMSKAWKFINLDPDQVIRNPGQ